MKKSKFFFMSMRILSSQVWAQSPSCDMLTKRKFFFFRHLPPFFSISTASCFKVLHEKLFKSNVLSKPQVWWLMKESRKEFLHLFFSRDLEKPNAWERAWFILCKCWRVCLTVTYCILQRWLFTKCPKKDARTV